MDVLTETVLASLETQRSKLCSVVRARFTFGAIWFEMHVGLSEYDRLYLFLEMKS
jgi:hypothetical protein